MIHVFVFTFVFYSFHVCFLCFKATIDHHVCYNIVGVMKPSKPVKPSPGNLGPKPSPKPKPDYLTGKGPGYHGNSLHPNKPSAAVWSPTGLFTCYVLMFICPVPISIVSQSFTDSFMAGSCI